MPWKRLVLLAVAAGVTGCSTTAGTGPVHVGPEVVVSKGTGVREYAEMIAAANPGNASELVACTMSYNGLTGETTNVVFSSFDQGSSWALTYVAPPFEDDPGCAYDSSGSAWFGGTDVSIFDMTHGTVSMGWLNYYRATDGGRNWKRAIHIVDPDFDRPYIIADTTQSRYRGRVYAYAWGNFENSKLDRIGASEFLWPYIDGSLHEPSTIPNTRDFAGTAMTASQGVITSNGTIVIAMTVFANGPGTKPRPTQIAVTRSTDGGSTLTAPSIVADQPPCVPFGAILPGGLAVDTSGGPFNGRIYLTWSSADRVVPRGITNHCYVRLVHSDDNGRTWSPPVTIHEAGDSHVTLGPNQYQPEAAVNRNGVVALSWYDTRDDPLNGTLRMRAAFSYDGGESFSSSVSVSSDGWDGSVSQPRAFAGQADAPGVPRNPDYGGDPKDADLTAAAYRFFQGIPGHTRAMVADASGAFHPFWFSDMIASSNPRNATQLVTATINVDGRASRSGDPSLDNFRDVTRYIAPYGGSTVFDAKDHSISMNLILVNNGPTSIEGPVRMRIKWAESSLGQPILVTPTLNGVAGNGAVLDVSSSIHNGRLAPGAQSAPIGLSFRISSEFQHPTTDEPISLAARIFARR